ncbi:MAG TPA: 2-amino-4-hydroxy-6-hydroxymethyldihydropteridine diphosphokinase [Rhodanobacteraceae bacterium]|jgi:2-amino-4-hydroxy-6-hydroxymethyldihydropteridine diphosphokinase|nr:2-amino-4-hydroxy-6-hydroxymethyldihydropteridine diphosphokinase [Rhodanobacteraceae bacterium]
MATAYVALGANLGDPRAQLLAAFDALAALQDTRLQARSRLYLTPPWGLREQPPFVNAVAQLDTGLGPDELLQGLLDIERAAGRERNGERWGPRRLDLDLLLHGDTVRDDARLTLPHPRMAERAFVLLPLAELAPQLDIPGHGRIAELLLRADTADCRVLAPAG